jgi:hypothetical protein
MRGTNGSILFDTRGEELLSRWLNGSQKTLTTKNGVWGDYLFANKALRRQILDQLISDATKRNQSGDVFIVFHAEIENGYTTGYEMLHGTNRDVGDFTVIGTATVYKDHTVYNVSLTWNDKIDPNFQYSNDKKYSDWAHIFYSPKNYTVHLSWNEKVTIYKK